MDSYEFIWLMLTYMRSNMFIYVLDVFMSLVWPASVLQAFFIREKSSPGILDYVNSGNFQICQNLNICVFWDLSEKSRAKKS